MTYDCGICFWQGISWEDSWWAICSYSLICKQQFFLNEKHVGDSLRYGLSCMSMYLLESNWIGQPLGRLNYKPHT